MDANTIFVKTAKATRIGMLWGGGLSSQSKRILSLIDGRLSVDQLQHLSEKLSKTELQKILLELEKDGYIHRIAQHETEPAWLHDVNAYSIAVEEIDAADFNFSDTAFSPVTTSNTKKSTSNPTPPTAQSSQAGVESTAKPAAENKAGDEIAAKAKREAERKAKAEAAEKVRREAEGHAKRIAEAEAKARQEMERIAREKAEAVAKAHAEELARQKAEAERKVQAEAEARAHATAEQKARLQAERIAREQAQAIAKAEETARLEAERKAKREAEERARAEAELKAQAEAAEQARLAAEMRVRDEAEARAKIEAERKEKEAQAEKARREAEEKARLESERMARELKEAKAKAEAEEHARQEAERKAQQAVEQARLEAERLAREQAETLARMEAERQAQEALVEKARQEAEEKARLESERMARELAEAKAKAEAEEQARLEAERRAQQAAEQARLEAERLAREQGETLARMEAEHKVQEALAAKARQEAETQARLDAERKELEKVEAITKATAEAEQKARLSEEPHLNEEASHSAIAAAEARAVIDASEQTRLEAERIAREDADEKAWQEAERKALAEAAEQAMHKVENLTREDVEAVREELQRVAIQEKKAKTRFSIKEDFAGRLTPGQLMTNKWIVKSMKVLPIMVPATLVILVVLVHFVNLGMLIKPIERLATASVGEPVAVREVHAALFPRPKLVLADVSVGDTAAVKIGAVNIVSGISMLFDDVKSLESIEISNVTLQPADAGRQMQWIKRAAQADNLKIGQIFLKNLSFNVPGVALEPFDGKVLRSASGAVERVELADTKGNLSLVLTPQSDACALTLNASFWKPPLLGPLELDEVSATGMISQGQASFSKIEAKAYGGTIRAQGVLNWSGNLSTSGNFELVKITLPRLLAAFGSGASVEGMLNAKAAFAANAVEATALVQGLEVNAGFEVLNGKINNLALSHAVMAGAAAKAQSGSDFTRFDTLTGSLQFKDGRYAYRQLALKTEQFQARGNLDIEQNQMVSGKISAELTSKTIRKQASFDVSGELANLKLQ